MEQIEKNIGVIEYSRSGTTTTLEFITDQCVSPHKIISFIITNTSDEFSEPKINFNHTKEDINLTLARFQFKNYGKEKTTLKEGFSVVSETMTIIHKEGCHIEDVLKHAPSRRQNIIDINLGKIENVSAILFGVPSKSVNTITLFLE